MKPLLLMRTRGLAGPFFDRHVGNRASQPLAHSSGNFIENDGLGLEMISNGDLGSDTIWTKGTGWTIAAGVASCSGAQVADSLLSQPITFVVGLTYRVVFTVSSYVAGNIKSRVGTAADGTNRAANGTFEDSLVYAAGTDFSLVGDLNFDGSIDNVSVKLVI